MQNNIKEIKLNNSLNNKKKIVFLWIYKLYNKK